MSNVARRPTMLPRSVPDDIDVCEKARGVVQLPHSLQWSGPRRRYDLAIPADRARVYEQVLRERTEQDLRRFIRVDALIALLGDLWRRPATDERVGAKHCYGGNGAILRL